MNIERAKIAIDKMASFIPEYVLSDLYKDHDATAEVLAQDENRVVFSIVYHDKKDKRILSITVKHNEINVHYNGTMEVFSHRIDESFYNDVLNVLFDVKTVNTVSAQSYAPDVTVTDKYIIKHNGFNIAYAQCRITGKFVKHMLAKNELMFSSIERYKTMLVLLLCVSANILGFSFLAFN